MVKHANDDSDISLLTTDKEYLTLTELPKFFAVTRVTITRWRNNESMAFPRAYAKVGGREIFSTKSLIKWSENAGEK